MFRPSPTPRTSFSIEPLEARIAPARIIQVGGPDAPNKADFNYSETVDPNGLPLFQNTEAGVIDGDLISVAVGGGVAGVADTFYLRLAAGDKLKLFQSANSFIDFLNVTSGNVIAFFVDQQADRTGFGYNYDSGTGQATFTYSNNFAVGATVRLDPTTGNLASLPFADYTIVAATPTSFTVAIAGAFVTGSGVGTIFDRDNEVQATELVSLSLGRNTGLELLSGVQGDIVTNLNEQGTKTLADDTLDMVDLVSPLQNIKSLAVRGGAVTGKILVGGAVTNVAINDGVNALLAGSAAFGQTFDLLPGVVGGNGTLSGNGGTSAVVPGSGVAGASITNVTVNANIVERIEAGGGGAGAIGGSLKQITIANDSDGFTLRAGKGGDGDAVRKNGGAGGSVSTVYVAGQDDGTLNNLVGVRAGDGGSSTTGGNGGKGGTVSSVFVGFQFIGGKTIQSLGVLSDNVTLLAGAGGAGKIGGAGGGILNANAIVKAANGLGDEISVVAGRGGDSNLPSGGRPGIGGSITTAVLRNAAETTGFLSPAGLGASILVQAGDGGTAAGLGSSAAGGSVTTVTLLGSNLTVLAGNGSDGKTGGAAGSVRTVRVLEGDNVIAHNLNLRAGRGGNGGQGSGGRGGLIDGVSVSNGDFSIVDLNQAGGGDGGQGTGGKGGAGGNVGRVDIAELDTGVAPAFEGTARIRAGNGGSGTTGGGAGGSILSGNLEVVDLNILVTSGHGGSILAGGKGNGGAAGSVRIGLAADETVLGVATTVTVIGGTGGSALDGTVGAGGAGGQLSRVVAIAQGTVSLTAGSGGNGATGAAGRGGSVISSVAFSDEGDARILAGSAGGLGTKAAHGGDILGTAGDQSPGAYGAGNISLVGGNGSIGGRGGSVKLVGFGTTSFSGLLAPAGDITVRGGNGSVEGKVAGAGGSIVSINGSVSTGLGKFTTLAGGGGGGGGTAAGAGGAVTNVSLSLGGGVGSVVRVEGGDAGIGGPSVVTGATGGSVSGVQIANLDPATVIRHISAGDGGTGTKRGGKGGSISDVTVLADDIGVRSGLAFGYETMGGLFAGAGGVATVAGATGKGTPGNVTNVRALAIAAIVAGKGAVPEEAGVVDFIYVGPDTDLLQASDVDPVTLIGDLNFADGGLVNWHSFTDARYQSANLVGAVVDPTGVDANKFKFINTDGSVDGAGNPTFTINDVPIDGLILAKTYRQQNTNFTPEARFVGGVFFDNDNLT